MLITRLDECSTFRQLRKSCHSATMLYQKMSNGRNAWWLCGLLSVAALITTLLLNMWFSKNTLTLEETTGEHIKDDLPFDISHHDVIFENGAGSFISLKPRYKFKELVEVKIVLDDPDIIDTIGSFKVEAGAQRTVFIPLHSKGVAGHCVMSFKCPKKHPHMKNLYKLRVKIKVVHEILFGYLSILLGWAYFCAWSVSYFPQLYSNFRRRSVVGLSFDYIGLNVTGHLCYCVFNAAMFYNSWVQKLYTRQHPKGELPVKANDNFFSMWAVAMNAILIGQCAVYERGEQRVSLPVVTLVGGLWVTILCSLCAAALQRITWLQFLYYLVFVKLAVTPLKYTPQVYLNYVRKSTEGWSIGTTFLDMMGGVLSILQMLVDTFNNDDWDGTLGNPGKVGLGVISIFYNVVMIVQHYCLYPKRPPRVRKLTDRDPGDDGRRWRGKAGKLLEL